MKSFPKVVVVTTAFLMATTGALAQEGEVRHVEQTSEFTVGFNSTRDDARIVDASLANSLPHAVVHSYGAAPTFSNQQVTLWAFGADGLSEKQWNRTAKAWNNGWVHRGNQSGVDHRGDAGQVAAFSSPTQWSQYLTMTASYDDAARARVHGMFSPAIHRSTCSDTPWMGGLQTSTATRRRAIPSAVGAIWWLRPMGRPSRPTPLTRWTAWTTTASGWWGGRLTDASMSAPTRLTMGSARDGRGVTCRRTSLHCSGCTDNGGGVCGFPPFAKCAKDGAPRQAQILFQL
jgi:hypothetical protein